MASDRLIKTLKRLQPLPITLYFTWSPVRLLETGKKGYNADKRVISREGAMEIYWKTRGPLLRSHVIIISQQTKIVS
jgi:hypothetical protein